MDLTDKLTPLLYLGKATTFQQCPKKYFWQHHLHFQPGVKPSQLAFGSFCHKMFLEIGIGQSFQISEALLQDRLDLALTLGYRIDEEVNEMLTSTSTADKQLCLAMLDVFQPRWQSRPREVFGIEKTVQYDISHLTNLFTHWCVKADVLFKDDEGFWIGDLKTTSSYGAATARYYHTSPQTKAYFWVLQQLMPNLRGTKIFVVTKKAIRCEVETIILSDQDKYEAKMFIEEAVRTIDKQETEFQRGSNSPDLFSRSMTSCINFMGQECPYIPICIHQIKSTTYLDDILQSCYKQESPDLHLELDKK